MIKDDLVFNWDKSDKRSGFKVIAFLIVMVLFTVVFGIVDVRFQPLRRPNLESASVLHFAGDELGQLWRQRAEEGGPFPGRLEIDPTAGLPGLYEAGDSGGLSGWSGYSASPREFQAVVGLASGELSQKGQRYLPERVLMPSGVPGKSPKIAKAVRRPILTPFDSNALEWMPAELPEFDMKLDGGILVSGAWRFMLSLRPDGSVDHCVSLSGGGEPGLQETANWLRGIRFESGEGERWLGLRVEFVNQ